MYYDWYYLSFFDRSDDICTFLEEEVALAFAGVCLGRRDEDIEGG